MSKDKYYADKAARLDTIIGGDTTHFLRLQQVKDEYDALAHAVPVGQGFLTFVDFVREWYGIEMQLNNHDGFGLDYKILDERKYTVFVLKFSV